jgi:hypothetical protein
MDNLHEQYPMMNTVLISDDSEYSYNVLGRIPPGASTQFYESVGLNRQVVDQFYQSKGDLSFMTEGDRLRFMSAIVDLGALLAIPKGATKQEWTSARNSYKELMEAMKLQFSPDIDDKIDIYYGLYRKDREMAKQFLQGNPAVAAAMDFQAATIAQNPTSILATYYGGIEQINNYYKGQMYDEAEQRYGAGIWLTQETYFSLSSSDKKAWLREHPELKEYWDYKNSVQQQINTQVIALGSQLSEPIGAEFREDLTGLGVGAQESLQDLLQPSDPLAQLSATDWIGRIGQEAFDVAVSTLRGEQISYRERKLLETAAERVGVSDDEVMQYIGITMTNP